MQVTNLNYFIQTIVTYTVSQHTRVFPLGMTTWLLKNVRDVLIAFENCAVLGYYAVNHGNFLLKFQDNLLIPSSGFKNPGFLKPEDGTQKSSFLSYSTAEAWYNIDYRSLVVKRKSLVRHSILGLVATSGGWTASQPMLWVSSCPLHDGERGGPWNAGLLAVQLPDTAASPRKFYRMQELLCYGISKWCKIDIVCLYAKAKILLCVKSLCYWAQDQNITGFIDSKMEGQDNCRMINWIPE